MKGQYILPILIISSLASATDPLRGINTFSNKLYDALPRKNTNLIFSPFSAHSVLSLAQEAAVGETALIMQRGLDLPGENQTALAYRDLMSQAKAVQKVSLEIANKIYVKSGYILKESFRNIARNYYAADATNIDFSKSAAAADEINGWVKEKTKDKIDRLVSPNDLDELTAALLLNAVYFKGNWLSRFNKKLTQKRPFHTSETETVSSDMMFQVGDFEYGEDARLDAKILRMKYKDERFAMVVVLPTSKTGIENLERSLSTVDITTLPLQQQEVHVSLPKFKSESTLQLKQPLQQIGLADIFDSTKANFSNMLETDREIYVSKVVQKAFVEVNEEGAEAAAATAVIFAFRSARLNPVLPKEFLADHPFLFYITAELGPGDENGKILFMGKVENPTA